jgi:hypothetical protein
MSTQQIESVRIGASQASSVPAGPWEIEDSLKFNDVESTHLTRTHSSAGNRRTYTISGWCKFTKEFGPSQPIFSAGTDNSHYTRLTLIQGNTNAQGLYGENRLSFMQIDGSGTSWTMVYKTDHTLLDFSSWYHVLVSVDTTQATNTDRVKIYLNGDLQTTQEVTHPAQNFDTYVNDVSSTHYIGKDPDEMISSYMAEMHLVDGIALTPSSFGTRGIYNEWKPIQYTGTHGTNGFYLDFKNTSCVNSSTSYDAEWTDDVNTRLLVKSNTTDGSATFTDTHGTYSLAAIGNVHHEIDQKKYGTTSMHFDGTGDYLSSANSLMNFGTSDFTIEGWVYPTANDPQAQAILGSGSNVSNGPFCRVFRDPNGYMYLYPMTAGGSAAGVKPWAGYLTSNIVTKLNEWSHFAFVREGDIWTVLINGCVGDSQIGTAGYSVSAGAGSSYIGKDPNIANFYFTGYMDEIRISNVARYTQAAMVASSSLGADASGNLNHFMPSGFLEIDQMPDTPSNNFCTLNPLAESTTNTLSEGNLVQTATSGNGHGAGSTFIINPEGINTYFEVYWEDSYAGTFVMFDCGLDHLATNYVGRGFNSNGNSNYVHGTPKNITSSTWQVPTFVAGDILQVYVKYNRIYLGKNGVMINSGHLHNQVGFVFTIDNNDSAHVILGGYNSNTLVANFGQDATFSGRTSPSTTYSDNNGIGEFFYQPPVGDGTTAHTDFLALCSKNLQDPAVIPSEHFNTVLYAGSGSVRTVTGVGFKPDLVWIHGRNDTSTPAVPNCFYDVVRGVQRNILIGPDSNSESVEVLNTNSLMSFDSDGFGLSTDRGVNSSSYNYASWNWKAGGTAVANTDGTTASSVSANATAGFSIATYTGNGGDATIGHGLSKAPEMIIIKNRTTGGTPWDAYHTSLGEDSMVYFSHDDAASIGTQTMWNSTSPTASVFTVRWQPPDTGRDVNRNGDSFVAYSFHSVDGFSKVGSYEGNGDASDNTFVHCGFKPAYVFIKRVTAIEHWWIFDSDRSPHNLMDDYMKVSSDEAEVINHTSIKLDFLSNGFKIRGNNTGIGLNGQEHIFMAFAEEPFKHSTAK